MKIKVSDRYKYAVTTNHIRQWCAALISLDGVTYISEHSEEWADFGIDCRDNVAMSICIELSDPHSLVNVLDVDTLQTRWFDIMPSTYTQPSIAFQNRGGASRSISFYEQFDIIAFVTWSPFQSLQLKSKLYHLPHNAPSTIFYSNELEKSIDVLLSGNDDPKWYPLRRRFKIWLEKEKNIHSFISNASGTSKKQECLVGLLKKEKQIQAYDRQLQEYSNLLRSSKIILLDGGVFDYPVKKYIEAMACGCLVLAPMPMDSELLGFVDGVNMVVVDESNFMEKCRYYLEHEDERKEITDAAYKLYQERHTCIKSAERFLAYLKTI
jgi:hypothetical protein